MNSLLDIYSNTTKLNFSTYDKLKSKKSIFLLFNFLLLLSCLLTNNAIAHDNDESENVISETEDKTKLSGFKPNYIIYGHKSGNDDAENMNNGCDIKFQISLKKQLSPPKSISDYTPNLLKKIGGKLFFGYTQKSFWDICRDSAPFRESNYNPSLFLENSLGIINIGDIEIHLPNSYGYEHESNGQAGNISRSWDRVYYEQYLKWGGLIKDGGFDKQKHFLHELGIKGWAIVEKGIYNDRAEQFLGNLEASYALTGKKYRMKLTARKKSGRLDLFIDELPIIKFGRMGEYWWLLQYFNGYGDSLERYDQHEQTIRFGVAFSN